MERTKRKKKETEKIEWEKKKGATLPPAPKVDRAVGKLVTASSAGADRQRNASRGLARLDVAPTEKPPTICWL